MRIQILASAIALTAAFAVSPALAKPPTVDPAANNQTIYPVASQTKGEEGVVKVNAYVRTNGRATRVKLLESSGYSDLDVAAIQTVMNWRFIPASNGGGAESDWTQLQIVYRLPNKGPAKQNP